MNLNHLRVFHAVVQAGSVTGAARSLEITQPAVSRQLGDLEEALATQLVDRLPRGIRLTAAGRTLADHAARIFGIEQTAEAELAALRGLQRGHLAVGASTTIGSYLVPRVFGRLSAKHPTLRLELEIGNTAAVHELVRRHVVELGLTEGLDVVASDLVAQVFAHDEMVAIAAPGSQLVRSRLTAAQLAAQPFIVRERGSGTREVIEAAFAAQGLTLAPAMSLGSTEAVKNAVAARLGIAMVSRLALQHELARGELVELDVVDFEVRRALHVVELRGVSRSPAAARFLELVSAG